MPTKKKKRRSRRSPQRPIETFTHAERLEDGYVRAQQLGVDGDHQGSHPHDDEDGREDVRGLLRRGFAGQYQCQGQTDEDERSPIRLLDNC